MYLTHVQVLTSLALVSAGYDPIGEIIWAMKGHSVANSLRTLADIESHTN